MSTSPPKSAAERERDALIVFRKEWYYLGLWYAYPGLKYPFKAGEPPLQMDFFGAIYREHAGAVWQLRYRHRYYATPDVRWPDRDRKSSVRATAPADKDPQALIANMSLIAEICAIQNQSRHVYLTIDGDGEKALEILRQQDFVHLQTERNQ